VFLATARIVSDIGERRAAIGFRLAGAEQVQVRPIQDKIVFGNPFSVGKEPSI